MLDLIHITREAEWVAESHGAALGVPSEWPGSFYDSVRLVKQQENAQEAARMKANS